MQKKMMKKSIALLLVLIMTVAFTACGGEKAGSGEEKTEGLNLEELYSGISDEKTMISVDEIVEAQAKGDYVIGVAMNTVSTPFFKALSDSIKSQIEAAGAKAQMVVCDEDASKQVSQIENFITQGVDAIIIKPADPAETISIALDKAYEANIPVITVDAPPAEDAKYLCSYITDAYNLGYMVGEEIAKQLIEKYPSGDIPYGIIGAIDGNTIATIRNDASRDGIADVDKEGRIKEVSYLYSGGFSEEVGLEAAENMIAANPDIKAIIGTCDAHIIGAASAAERLNKKDIIMGAIDGSKTAMELMKDGKSITALAWNSPKEVGRAAVCGAIALLNGDGAPASRTMVIKGEMITPDNVDQFYDPNSAF